MSDYLIHRRELKNGTRPPDEKKAAKPIARRSEKLKEEMKVYKPKVKEFLARPENQVCKIYSPVCTIKATCVHHSAGRTGKQLMNEADWIPSCTPCNGWVSDNDSEAREMGVVKTRLIKVK